MKIGINISKTALIIFIESFVLLLAVVETKGDSIPMLNEICMYSFIGIFAGLIISVWEPES